MREVLVSQPDQAIVVRISADKPGSISFTAQLQRQGERTPKAGRIASSCAARRTE